MLLLLLLLLFFLLLLFELLFMLVYYWCQIRANLWWRLVCLFVEQFHFSSSLFHPCFGLFCPVFPMSVISAFF
jgi:hypothetical protein